LNQVEREQLIAFATEHRLIPQVSRILREPDLARANAFRNLQLFAHLADVAAAFEKAGLEYVSIKGPVLAHQLYGDISMRVCEDIDVLVRKKDLARAAQLVRTCGYSVKEMEQRHFDREHDVACTHEDGTLLELHVSLTQPHYSYEIPLDEWFARSTTEVVSGRRIRTLALEDAALFAIIHATKHAWSRFDFLTEMQAFEQSAVDWDVVETRAQHIGALRAVKVARELASLRPKSAAAKQAWQAMQAGGLSYWQTRGFDLRVRERWQDRVRYVLRLVLKSIGLPRKVVTD
jgi:hypothetical protein